MHGVMSERWRAAAIEAPCRPALLRADTRVVSREGWWQVITPSSRTAHLNEIVISRLDAADTDAAIDEAIATYAAHAAPVKWCVGPWTEPADLGARLEARGFRGWDVRGMACPASLAIDAPPDVLTERVESGATLDAYLACEQQGWAMPDDERDLHRGAIERALASARLELWLARIEGDVVGTTGLVEFEDHAYFFGAQVLERARGRGAYRALLDVRLRRVRERGLAFAVTQARAATSAPILARLGWTPVFESRCYVLERAPA